MDWLLLALTGACAQAVGAAVKKKTLQTPGMNNAIGFLSFSCAGIIFWLLHALNSGSFWIDELSLRFWYMMLLFAGLNIIGVWFMYKALDLAEFNHLMPFMTVTSLSLVIPPMIFLNEFPSLWSFGGIVLIVWGAIYMNYKSTEKGKRYYANRKGVVYFLVTALCFTFTPTAAKVMIQESSVLFASAISHLLIALGFLAILLVLREQPKLFSVFQDSRKRKFLVAVLFVGVVTVLENGSINAALEEASVASVFAIKRMMPFFAFIIGIMYFRERADLRKKILATTFMVVGAIMLTLF